jgi:hypothetical protein
MNTVEQFHIYQVTKLNNQINDKYTVQPKGIFQILVHMCSDGVHQYPLPSPLLNPRRLQLQSNPTASKPPTNETNNHTDNMPHYPDYIIILIMYHRSAQLLPFNVTSSPSKYFPFSQQFP